MSDFLSLALARTSTRRYSGDRIPDEKLRFIAEAALTAPSSFGRHPVHFWVVRGGDKLRQLAACKRMGVPSVAAADAAIVVAVDANDCELWVEDGSVASAYELLAAEEAGVGACWNQIHDRVGRRVSASDEIKALLDIPARFEVVSIVALGMPVRTQAPRTLADFPKENIHCL